MPVETRAQTRAREEAEKGPAGRAGARATSSRAVILSSSASTDVPASPAVKKALAARKASAQAAAAAAAAAADSTGKKGKKGSGKKSAAGGSKKKGSTSTKSAFDSMLEELGGTLPHGDPKSGKGVAVGDMTLDAIVLTQGTSGKRGRKGKGEDVREQGGFLESEFPDIQSLRVDDEEVIAASVEKQLNPPPTKSPVTSPAPKSVLQQVQPNPPPPLPTLQTIDPDHDDDITDSGEDEEYSPGGVKNKETGLPTASATDRWVDPYPDLSPAERAETISGYVCYRTDYSHSAEDWEKYRRVVMDRFKRQEMRHEKDEAGLEIIWVEDKGRFGGDKVDEVRKAFNEWCIERNPHAPDPSTYPFSEGRYQDFTPNLCLAADRQSISSVLLRSYGTSPNCPPATILVVDRHYSRATHEAEIADCSDEEVRDAYLPSGAIDPREADAEVIDGGDKVVWKGYKGCFRAALEEWMNIESEAQAERDLPSYWMQYFAKYAEGRASGWELTACGVLE